MKATNIIYYILVFLSLQSCGQEKKEKPNVVSIQNTTKKGTIKKSSIKNIKYFKLAKDSMKSYNFIKKSIRENKQKWQQEKLKTDSLSQLFKNALLHRIIPFWEGTEWSFEGHTSTPRKGQIACGYFISTTLKHAGLYLNRYKLAQQNPKNEAISLALNTKVIEIAEASTSQNIAKINKILKEGIHFIGFDQSHVGYILKEKGELYLIHSNYINSKGVELEEIEKSSVFSSYDKFYIAEISTNEKLLKNWIANTEIEIMTRN